MGDISSVSNPSIGGLIGGLGGSGSAMFNAISGNGASASPASGLLSAISGGSGQSTDELLRQQKIDQQRNRMLTEVSNRLGYIQQGRMEPNADWEKVAAYSMETGQPVVATLDAQGQIQALPQADSDLSRYSQTQQNQLYEAFDQVAEISAKVRGNKENDKLVKKLEGANTVINGLVSNALTPQSEWERDALRLMTSKVPFKIALSAKGDLMVQDQRTMSYGEMPYDQQKVLRKAASELPALMQSGTYTQLWQAEAKSMTESGTSFHLDVDPYTKQIEVKANSGDNIVPKFLRDKPYPDVGANTPWKEDVVKMIEDGKAFFLDFDQSGQITAKEATAPNLIKYNTPKKQYNFNAGAVMSILV